MVQLTGGEVAAPLVTGWGPMPILHSPIPAIIVIGDGATTGSPRRESLLERFLYRQTTIAAN